MKNFVIEREDGSLTTLLKREANIKLASLSNDEERTKAFYDCQSAIKIAKAIDSIEPQSQEEVDSVLNIINKIQIKNYMSKIIQSYRFWQKACRISCQFTLAFYRRYNYPY